MATTRGTKVQQRHTAANQDRTRTNSNSHWKPDYRMPVPEDADRRFTRWQGELESSKQQQKSWGNIIGQSIQNDIGNVDEWISSTMDRLRVAGETVLPQHQASYAEASSHSSRLFKNIRAIEQQGRYVDLHEVAKLPDLTHSAAQSSYAAAKSQLYAAGTKGLIFAGRISGIYDYGNSVYTVMQAEESQRGRVAFEQAGEQFFGTLAVLAVNSVTAQLSLGTGLAVSIPLSVGVNATARPLGKMGGGWTYENVYLPVKHYIEPQIEEANRWLQNRF